MSASTWAYRMKEPGMVDLPMVESGDGGDGGGVGWRGWSMGSLRLGSGVGVSSSSRCL